MSIWFSRVNHSIRTLIKKTLVRVKVKKVSHAHPEVDVVEKLSADAASEAEIEPVAPVDPNLYPSQVADTARKLPQGHPGQKIKHSKSAED